MAGGEKAQGGQAGGCPRHQERPPPRREQKTALCDAPGTVLRDRFISGGTLWEGPETRCNNDGFCFRR